jgi:hypothetical protein
MEKGGDFMFNTLNLLKLEIVLRTIAVTFLSFGYFQMGILSTNYVFLLALSHFADLLKNWLIFFTSAYFIKKFFLKGKNSLWLIIPIMIFLFLVLAVVEANLHGNLSIYTLIAMIASYRVMRYNTWDENKWPFQESNL